MNAAVRLVMAKRDCLDKTVRAGKLAADQAYWLSRYYAEGVADSAGLSRLDLQSAVEAAELEVV